MFKKRRLNSDGWQPDIVRMLIDNPRQRREGEKSITKDYSLILHGFTQRLREEEVERKLYGTLRQVIRPDVNVFIVVEFVIASGDDFYYIAQSDQNPDMLSRKNWGWFCFNVYDGEEKSRIPAMYFKIILPPKEWEDVKECLWLAKWQNSCPTMTIRVEYPGNPDPETVVNESYQQTFRVRRFWINSLVAFDSEALSKNLVFREDIWDWS